MDIVTIILTLFFLFLAGVFDGVRDTLAFHYHRTRLPKDSLFWNPKHSWRNKYKNGDPDAGPRFPGSITVFVWLTDAWHLFQFLFLGAFRLALLVLASEYIDLPWYAWAGLWLASAVPFNIGFHLIYTVIFYKGRGNA